MALGAVIAHAHRLDARIVRSDLFGQRVIGLQAFQHGRGGDTGGKVFSGPAQEIALAHVAVDIAVEQFEDIGIKVFCSLACHCFGLPGCTGSG